VAAAEADGSTAWPAVLDESSPRRARTSALSRAEAATRARGAVWSGASSIARGSLGAAAGLVITSTSTWSGAGSLARGIACGRDGAHTINSA
jgi:hypothetical protein